jgi:monovalent cation:H+ antiporter, CPA1 family
MRTQTDERAMASIDIVAMVLVLAALLGAINDRYVRLPAPIGMLLGSLLLATLLALADVVLHVHVLAPIRDILAAADLPHVFLDWVLALLLFAGSLHVDLVGLRQQIRIITVLATAGVVISATVFCVGLWTLLQVIDVRVPLAWCFVLGAILAPTDAVVVEALLGRSKMPASTRAAIVGESLFNDGAGVVLFLVALRMVHGETGLIGHGRLGLAMAQQLIGGAAVGCACGTVAGWLMRRVADDAVRVIASLALVVGCYRLADACDVSGPVAVVCAGLLLGYVLRTGSGAGAAPHEAAGSGAIITFWSLLDSVLNLGLFLLIGLEVLALIVSSRELAVAAATVPLALAARAISVAVPMAVAGRGLRVVARQTTVLTWAGMRGGVSIALALTVPVTVFRGQLLVMTYTIVLFSIIVQGLTLPGLLARLYRDNPAPPPTPAGATQTTELLG